MIALQPALFFRAHGLKIDVTPSTMPVTPMIVVNVLCCKCDDNNARKRFIDIIATGRPHDADAIITQAVIDYTWSNGVCQRVRIDFHDWKADRQLTSSGVLVKPLTDHEPNVDQVVCFCTTRAIAGRPECASWPDNDPRAVDNTHSTLGQHADLLLQTWQLLLNTTNALTLKGVVTRDAQATVISM